MPQKRQKTGFPGPSPDVGKATQFQPGKRANPGGRPKAAVLSKAYRDVLQSIDPKDPKARTVALVIAEALAKKAKRGDVRAAQELADRAEGKPLQAVNVSASVEMGAEDRVRASLRSWPRSRPCRE